MMDNIFQIPRIPWFHLHKNDLKLQALLTQILLELSIAPEEKKCGFHFVPGCSDSG